MIGGKEDERETITSFSALCLGAGGMQQKARRSGGDDRGANDRSSNDRDRDDGARSTGDIF